MTPPSVNPIARACARVKQIAYRPVISRHFGDLTARDDSLDRAQCSIAAVNSSQVMALRGTSATPPQPFFPDRMLKAYALR
jgi:hypothetical protein